MIRETASIMRLFRTGGCQTLTDAVMARVHKTIISKQLAKHISDKMPAF